MNASEQRIVHILMQAGLLDETQARAIGARLNQLGGKPHDLAVDLGFTSEAQVAGALAAAVNMPRLKLDEIPVDEAALRALPAGFCEQHLVFPCALRDNNKTLWVAMHDPLDVGLLDQIRARANVARANPGVAGRGEIVQTVKLHYYGIRPNTGQDGGITLRDDDDEGEQEFKVTDISGRTTVRHVAGAEKLRDDFKAPVAAAEAFAPVAPAARPAPVPTGVFAAYREEPPPPVDGVFATGAAASPDALESLRALQASMERTSKVLRAMIELCIQKGLFSVEEYKSRVNK